MVIHLTNTGPSSATTAPNSATTGPNSVTAAAADTVPSRRDAEATKAAILRAARYRDSFAAHRPSAGGEANLSLWRGASRMLSCGAGERRRHHC